MSESVVSFIDANELPTSVVPQTEQLVVQEELIPGLQWCRGIESRCNCISTSLVAYQGVKF